MQDAINRIVTPVLDRLDAVLGTGYSAVLYGSAARGEFVAGVSDVNLLIVTARLDPATLQRLADALAGLRAGGQPPPLLMEREEWERASDVFPIELTEMLGAREVVRGTDPVAGLSVDTADLRRALEGEFRARLLRLRQAYAAAGGDARLLGEIAGATVTSVVTLFRAALALYEHPAPAATAEALASAGQLMAVATAPVSDLWNRRRSGERSCPPALFEGYLSAVAAAVRVTDQFTRGGN